MATLARGGGGNAAPAPFQVAPVPGLMLPPGMIVASAMGEGVPDLLSPEERALSAGYGARRRVSFVLGRSLLRTMAGAALGSAPCEVSLSESAGGGLLLSGTPWHVNLTHVGNLAGCVLALHRVGIDAEVIRPRAEGLWRRILAPGEQAPAWPGWNDTEALLLAWTAKEAALKAAGIGLRRGAAAAVLSFPPREGLLAAITPEGRFSVSVSRVDGVMWAVAWEG